jgi:hypothetical protein
MVLENMNSAKSGRLDHISVADISKLLHDSGFGRPETTGSLTHFAESTLERTRAMGTPLERARSAPPPVGALDRQRAAGTPAEQQGEKGTPSEQARCKQMDGNYDSSTVNSLHC